MNKKNILAAIMLVAGGATLSVAQAHAKIESSEPKADSELSVSPKEIRLHFNEEIEPAFSGIQLLDANEAAIPLPKIAFDQRDPRAMSTTLPSLNPGHYSVRWSAMTHDGHKAKGQYTFVVK
jgi:methionine-rich copper-binding protein CopC